ncbi:MAG: hypothetical protein KGJ76_15295 [Betaproteobacteria bacterium]|nr:hypothetical protein [Betaproteobacteria bacterium]
MKLTKHSAHRMQQRGIPRLMIEMLQRFGKRAYDHHGGVVRYLDKSARRTIEKYVGSQVYRRMHEFHDAYLVEAVDNGTVITCGHRFAGLHLH